jgi:hypothetical protein
MVYAVSFSPNGQYLASGSFDKHMFVWRVEDGRLMHSHRGRGGVFDVSWNSAGTKLAGCLSNAEVVVLDLAELSPASSGSGTAHGDSEAIEDGEQTGATKGGKEAEIGSGGGSFASPEQEGPAASSTAHDTVMSSDAGDAVSAAATHDDTGDMAMSGTAKMEAAAASAAAAPVVAVASAVIDDIAEQALPVVKPEAVASAGPVGSADAGGEGSSAAHAVSGDDVDMSST